MKKIDAMNPHQRRAAVATFVLLALAMPAHAGPRSSANYSITTDTADSAGNRTTSANYTNDGSAGGVIGVSTVAAPTETAKHGYIGQLYEVTALTIAASPTTVNEGLTRQLSGSQLLDDLTTIAVPANSITWSIVCGPLSSIDSNGLATAGTVFQNTAATAQGVFAGNIGTLGLTVLDSIADNFGTYAGDGLGDDWQVQFFGQPPNANAGPLLDPDFDGHNNLFEFTAGIIPTDAASKFNWRIDPVPGFPTQKKLTFSPRFVTRTYTVKTATTVGIAAVWSNLTGGIISDNGSERTITDTSATGDAKFYTVEIMKP